MKRLSLLIAWIPLFLLGTLPLAGAEKLEISPELAEILEHRYPRDADELRLLEQQVQRVADQTAPATVGIRVRRNFGSGVIVNSEGLVLTAAHVIGRPNRRATILLANGNRLEAQTLGANHELDIGMLRITDPPADLPYVPFNQEKRARLGEWVVATGQPGGTLDDRTPPVRLGRVLASELEWICSDCTLVGGDSGGPLVNLEGEVIGIHTSIGPEVVHNFHVPLATAKIEWQRLLDGEVWGGRYEELAQRANRPVLGLAGRTVDDQCIVTQVFPGLPADEAGIRPGDMILALDDQPVDSFSRLAKLLQQRRPRQQVSLRIQRNGDAMKLEVTLAGIRVPLPGSEIPELEE